MVEKKKQKGKIAIIILIIVILILGVVAGFLYYKMFNSDNTQEEKKPIIFEKNDDKKVQIYSGNERPIAIMIDNHKAAMPHAGLSKAYIVYEIIVEGGESRLMALFKGQDVDKIGPVRSSRHYFLDYALENDAIYVHYGWSPQAESDISNLGVNNINGITEDANDFWRTSLRSAPHNVLTSTENIMKIAKSKGYRTTSSAKSVLNYSVDEINLGNDENKETNENSFTNTNSSTNSSTRLNTITNNSSSTSVKAINATSISIPYSESNNVKWTYDESTKRYSRTSKGIKETEWFDGTDVTAKNIIIEFIANSTLDDGSGKGRQTLDTTGTKDGYYITNGKAIKIKCTKATRKSKTEYKDLNGNEIKVNDGNTFIQIVPINSNVSIE